MLSHIWRIFSSFFSFSSSVPLPSDSDPSLKAQIPVLGIQGWDLGLKTEILASRLGIGLDAEIWAWRLGGLEHKEEEIIPHVCESIGHRPF